MKTALAILILCSTVLAGCASHSKTSLTSNNPNLQPQTIKGSIEEVRTIACVAGEKAFPEAVINCGDSIIISRDWLWRGDSTIEILVNRVNDLECLVVAESRGDWRRGNALVLNVVSEEELRQYIEMLRTECQSRNIRP